MDSQELQGATLTKEEEKEWDRVEEAQTGFKVGDRVVATEDLEIPDRPDLALVQAGTQGIVIKTAPGLVSGSLNVWWVEGVPRDSTHIYWARNDWWMKEEGIEKMETATATPTENPQQDVEKTKTQPSYYKSSTHSLDALDVIEMFNLGFHEANCFKYLVRWKEKNGLEDLKKAKEYLTRLIEKEKK